MNANAKTWLITYPNGEEKYITNLSKFCEENGLDRANMHAVSIGKRKQHKGFTCVGGDLLRL